MWKIMIAAANTIPMETNNHLSLFFRRGGSSQESVNALTSDSDASAIMQRVVQATFQAVGPNASTLCTRNPPRVLSILLGCVTVRYRAIRNGVRTLATFLQLLEINAR